MNALKCLGIVLAGLLFSSCVPMENFGERGSGRLATEQRNISGITGVSLHTAGKLFIEVGNAESLRIEADDNLIPQIETDVRDGILTIQTRRMGNLLFTQPARYYLTIKNLNSIAIFSSGDIQAPDLKAERFSINISSSGNLRMGDLQTDALKVNMSSSGDMIMGVLSARSLDVEIGSSGDLRIGGGDVKRQNITIHSSGDYEARNLASEEAIVSLNSSGDAVIRVKDQLTANLNSSGDLRYQGNPMLNINKGSSGDLIHLGN